MKKFKLLLAAALFAVAGSASAAQIDGAIFFGGAVDGFDITANSVDINNSTPLVTLATGTFSTEGVAAGQSATYNDFYYNPISGANPLWSIGGFDFELTQITFIDESSPGFLDLQGKGIVSNANYGDTLFGWSLSIDSITVAGQTIFAFSSTNASVPEPSIALLLATGLIGFGLVRRVRKSA